MRFAELDALIAEAKTVSEAEFADRHPTAAFVVESPQDNEKDPTQDTATATGAPADYEKGLTLKIPRSAFAAALDLPPATKTKVHWPSSRDERLIRFGRESTSEIQLVHARISKRHASIQRVETSGPDAWVARDEGSSNGTTLNDKPLLRNQLSLLEDGDRLVLGRAVTVRPMFTPNSLYRFVQAAAAGYPGARTPRTANFDLLSRAICSVGAATGKFRVEFTARAPGGGVTVLVSVEHGLVAVESGQNGVYSSRKTVSLNDARAQEAIRRFLFEAIGTKEQAARPGAAS